MRQPGLKRRNRKRAWRQRVTVHSVREPASSFHFPFFASPFYPCFLSSLFVLKLQLCGVCTLQKDCWIFFRPVKTQINALSCTWIVPKMAKSFRGRANRGKASSTASPGRVVGAGLCRGVAWQPAYVHSAGWSLHGACLRCCCCCSRRCHIKMSPHKKSVRER